MTLRTVTTQDRANLLVAAAGLKAALHSAKLAKCPQLTKAIRRARKSADGALRHIDRALISTRPPIWTPEDGVKARPDGWGVATRRHRVKITGFSIAREPGSRFLTDDALVRHLKQISSKNALARKALKLANLIW